MTNELKLEGLQSIPESASNQPEIIKFPDNDSFFDGLYASVVDWIVEGGGQIHKEFPPNVIEQWERVKPSVELPLKLKKACTLTDNKKNFILTLGQGWKSRYYAIDYYRLQYSFFPKNWVSFPQPDNFDLNTLKTYIYPSALSGIENSLGEIFAPPKGNIQVSSWITILPFGHERFKNWKKEDILSTKGIVEALSVIQDQVRRAYEYDLT